MAKQAAHDDKPPASVASQLRDLLTRATEADVAEIDAEIAVKKGELASLEANRDMLAKAIGMEPAKRAWSRKPKDESAPAAAPAAKPAAGTDLVEKRRKVARWIKANGAKHLDKVSEGTGISRFGPGALGSVVLHDWFHVTPDGTVKLTEVGERAANELK